MSYAVYNPKTVFNAEGLSQENREVFYYINEKPYDIPAEDWERFEANRHEKHLYLIEDESGAVRVTDDESLYEEMFS